MGTPPVKLKRTLGFAPAYGAAVGLVVSGTAMFAVGNVAGTTGYATFLTALIALVPMMMTAFAFGEMTAMLPGGGMISDYTMPALGPFFATFALLSGYLVLIAADGGTQLVMGGLSVEEICGIPQVAVTLALFAIVVAINVWNVSFYGKVEATVTVAMMVIFALFSLGGVLRLGESFGAEPVNARLPFLPEGGWSTVVGATGSAIWFFIGFEFACPMAEENKKPYRNIPYALIIGLLTIYAIDSLFAAAAVRYTDLTVLRGSPIPQTMAAGAIFGEFGKAVMTVLTILASFTTANAYVSSLPRMLYGLAREGLFPKIFARIHPKTRTPVVGIVFTGVIILAMVAYITVNGADTGIVTGVINTASITWMVSYAIAMIDVLVLRRRYPDYPRLWKAPAAPLTMGIGLVGVVYAIYTLRAYLLPAAACMVCIAVYCGICCYKNKIKPFQPVPIDDLAQNIRRHSEALPVWDAAVDAWCKAHGAK